MESPAFWGGVAAARMARAGHDTLVMQPGPNSLGPALVRGFQHAYGGRLRADGTLVFSGVRKDILAEEIQLHVHDRRSDQWARGYFAGAASESSTRIRLVKGEPEVLDCVRDVMRRSMPDIEIPGGPGEPIYIGKRAYREHVKAHWLTPPPGTAALLQESVDAVNRRAERRDIETVNRERMARNIRPRNARLTPTEVRVIRAIAEGALASDQPFSIHIAVAEARRRVGHVTEGQVRRALGDLLPTGFRARPVPDGVRARVLADLCGGYTIDAVRQKMRRSLPEPMVLTPNTLRQYLSGLRTGATPPPQGPVPTWEALAADVTATGGPVVHCTVDWMCRDKRRHRPEEEQGACDGAVDSEDDSVDWEDDEEDQRPSESRLLAYWAGAAQFTHAPLPQGGLRVNPGEFLLEDMQAQFGGARDGKFLVLRGPAGAALLDRLAPHFDGAWHEVDWAQGVLAARATVTPRAIQFFDMRRPQLVDRLGTILRRAFPTVTAVTVTRGHIGIEGARVCAALSRWLQAPV